MTWYEYVLAGKLPDGVGLATELNNNKFDFVQLFVKNQGDVGHRGPDAYRALKEDGLKELGLEPVSQVAVDDTWSALRFRPSDKVKHGKR
ncbi:MAG: hypothetical protein ACM3RP_01415 [Chitinophagales bacterium]